MKKYEYKFIEVPVVFEKKGIINIVHKGDTFEECKLVINKEAVNGWRLKQVVVPFNEKSGVYGANCYQVIFEKELD
ncbi:MAG: DUF4177 domain-containing protein [Beduini sp.]|uniref:DUF4177 domain-containing protein n=1 Tax=Beduini sp. TaxID=1922300 RepID=UPI0011C85BD4